MLSFSLITLLFITIVHCKDYEEITSSLDSKSGHQPKYWRAILGDICQLPSFPRATADPIRYVECVRQSTDITDRKDLGIWLLRECLPGYEFVASARRCKTIRSVKRQQQLCDGPNAQNYQFCPHVSQNNEHFIIHEIQQAPKQCACPNGENNCVCPTPEILEPQLVKSKVVRRNVETTGAPVSSIAICAICPSTLTSCYCPTGTEAQQQRPVIAQQPTQVPQQQWDSHQQPGSIPTPSAQLQQQQQPAHVLEQTRVNSECACPETACVCISIGVEDTTGTVQQQSQQSLQTVQPQYTQQQQQQQPVYCQTTTTQQQYCPQYSQEQYIVQPQPCPLVQGQSTSNAQYQGICSWMVDPLATDPQSNTHYLQCQPAPNNLFCGRWQRMPCPSNTIFDVNAQVCVWDPNAAPVPGNLPSSQAPSQYQPVRLGGSTQIPIQQYQPTPIPVSVSTTQPATCSCTGGVQIGSCSVNYQCPGQSVCQVGGQPGQQCMVCCYFHQPRQ